MKRPSADGSPRSSCTSSPLRQVARRAPATDAASEGSELKAPHAARAASPACSDASADSVLRGPPCAKRTSASESGEEPAGESGQQELQRAWSQRGLVTKAEVTTSTGTATVEIYPLDADTRYYWAMTCRNAVGLPWQKLFQQRGLKSPWMIDSGATALGAEFHVVEAMGIPISIGDAQGCDPCSRVREILLDSKRHVFGHFWSSFEDHIKMCGHCSRHGQLCDASSGTICPDKKCVRPEKRRHCAVLGPPCQPWSPLSAQNKRNRASSHPLFHVIFPRGMRIVGYGGGSTIDYLAVHLPLTAIIEEVTAFGELDHADGIIYLRAFLELVRQIVCPWSGQQWFTGIEVLVENPGKWLDIKRPRFSA